jgi:hypothetical protein
VRSVGIGRIETGGGVGAANRGAPSSERSSRLDLHLLGEEEEAGEPRPQRIQPSMPMPVEPTQRPNSCPGTRHQSEFQLAIRVGTVAFSFVTSTSHPSVLPNWLARLGRYAPFTLHTTHHAVSFPFDFVPLPHHTSRNTSLRSIAFHSAISRRGAR